jgi:signal transduction histidine kinase
MKRPHFRTNVLLKNIVGKDLINDDNIAVSELVKNAYDAGAKKVDIYLKNFEAPAVTKGRSPDSINKQKEDDADIKKGESEILTISNGSGIGRIEKDDPEILIVDNGSGMSRTDIEEKWLNIAYSEKKYETKKGKRIMAGNKGVGRFSCDRLGKKLEMFTRSSGGDLLRLRVDWEKFEVENKPDFEIQKITVALEDVDLETFKESTGLNSLTKGTVLRITELRSQWDKDALISLRRNLERLFNPNQAFEKETFTLNIIVPSYEEYDKTAPAKERINGEVVNQIFDRLNFKATSLESETDEKGEFVTTVLRHDGNIVYEVVEKNNFKSLKLVKIVIYFLNPYKKTYFKKQTGLNSVEFGSIFLFINGFRIPPYGNRGDDWLGLDGRKSQGINRYISTRDIVGRIEIEDFENRFKVVSSREGIVKDQSFQQLINFYYKTHKRLEAFVVNGLDWDSIPDEARRQLRSSDAAFKWTEKNEEYLESGDQKTRRIAENLLNILNATPESVVSLNLNAQLLEQLSNQEQQTLNQILSHFEKYDAKVIDKKLSGALQELRDIVEKQTRRLKRLEDSLAKKESQLEELKSDAANKEAENLFLKSITTLDQDNLLNFLHQIGLDSSTIKNTTERLLNKLSKAEAIDGEFLADSLDRISFANKKILAISQFATKANFKFQSQTMRADLVSFVEQYLQNVAKDYIAANLKISIEGHDAAPFEVKMKPIEVSIILDNLLSNAKKAGAKEVKVKIHKIAPDSLEILFKDDGKGLSTQAKDIQDIFKKGFTTTTGSGLGLYHVSQILTSMNGTITAALTSDKGRGLEFRIRVRK